MASRFHGGSAGDGDCRPLSPGCKEIVRGSTMLWGKLPACPNFEQAGSLLHAPQGSVSCLDPLPQFFYPPALSPTPRPSISAREAGQDRRTRQDMEVPPTDTSLRGWSALDWKLLAILAIIVVVIRGWQLT